MAKRSRPDQTFELAVRDARTGQIVTVKGAGALKGSGFTLRKGIDLTKPIAPQASKGVPAAKSSASR